MDCENKIYKPSSNDMSSEDMKKYAGEYVIIHGYETSGEKIINHSKNYERIVKLAKNNSKDEVLIDYIPKKDTIFF